jgi:hypothetical protein
MFVATEADFARIAGTLSDDLPGEFGPDRWRFRKYQSTRDAAWEGLADIYEVVRRHAARPGVPAAAAVDLRLKPEIVQHSQRRIRLLELRQSYTYEGLLMGLPTTENNRKRLDSLAAAHRHYGRPAHLIEPAEEPIAYGDTTGKPYPLGTPARLPPILCVARFESTQPARDTTADGSGLAVVWFQRHFAFPIDEDVVKVIKAIDWMERAGDFSD